MSGRTFASILCCLVASPALAQGAGAAIPEPSASALLGLGLAGVAIGRYLSRNRPAD